MATTRAKDTTAIVERIEYLSTTTPLVKIFDAYLHFYASVNSHTGRAKRLDVDHFLSFLLKENPSLSLQSLTVSHWNHVSTERFVELELTQGAAPASVARRLATLKHAGRVLAERIPGFINPARDARPPAQRPNRPKAIPDYEISAVNERLELTKEKNDFSHIRNRAIFYLLLDTGLRVDEARTLRLNQLDIQLRWIQSVRTKGKKYRNVYLSTQIRELLKEYLEHRLKHLQSKFPSLTTAKSNDLPLFVSLYGARLDLPHTFEVSPKSLWRIIRGFSVETKLHPHLLRHSYAHDLLNESNDIRLVAQALGHSDVRTTMKYTERSESEIARVTEQARRRKHNS